MKIAIAKSLLEPVGIPWFLITCGEIDLARHIRFILLGNFHDMKLAFMLPAVDDEDNPIRFSTKIVCSILETIALNNGATWVNTMSYHVFRNKRQIGHSFRIHFKVPGDDEEHIQWMDTHSK